MSQIKTNTAALQDILNAASNLPKPIDTSDATATSSKILSGYTAYVDNKMIAGNIPNKTGYDISVNGNTVNIPAGNYENDVLKSVGIATQATPSISVSSSGLITASANQDAGYVASGTKSSTKQLTTQAAKTVTPGTSNQTAVSSGVYTTGAVTVKGDANLKAENILSGKSIFGVNGGIPNNGDTSQTMDGINTKSISIPAGYTSGGTVGLDGSIDTAVDNAISALVEKGIEVPDGTKVDGLAALIASIETGGSFDPSPFSQIMTGTIIPTNNVLSFTIPEEAVGTVGFLFVYKCDSDDSAYCITQCVYVNLGGLYGGETAFYNYIMKEDGDVTTGYPTISDDGRTFTTKRNYYFTSSTYGYIIGMI